MAKIFITGRGLISPIGRGVNENLAALKSGKSGIVYCPEFEKRNLDCKVAGVSDLTPPDGFFDRKFLRFAPISATSSVEAVLEAINEAGLSAEAIRGKRVAVIGGIANGNGVESFECVDSYTRSNYRLRNVTPFIVPRVMPSAAVSIISLYFGLTGETYDISAACASSTLSVIVGARLIRSGEYDMVLVGGAEPLDWVQAVGFSAMRALETKYNDNPSKASRPFDKNRGGFVLASGAAWLLLESEASIKQRNGKAITEITGLAANSNALDMVVPDADSSEAVIRLALKDSKLAPEQIKYVNTHGTATPVGDPVEMNALKNVFGGSIAINSTKSQTGHMIGATGAAEIIFTSLMLEHDFISPSINLDEPEEEFAWADLVRQCRENVKIKHAISNSFAFGGSNACVVLSDCK